MGGVDVKDQRGRMWCLNKLSFLLHTALVFHQKKAIKLLPLQP